MIGRNWTFWVFLATHTGLEPVIFCVTGRRINQLSQWAILAPIGAICIRLDFEWLRVFSLIRSQLPGRDSGTRTHTLLRAPAPQAGLSTNSSISPYMWLIYVLMESPTTAGYLLSVVAWTNTPLGRDALVPNKGLEPLRHKTSEPKSDVSANSTNSANSARHTSIQAYLDNRITLTVVQTTRASILH